MPLPPPVLWKWSGSVHCMAAPPTCLLVLQVDGLLPSPVPPLACCDRERGACGAFVTPSHPSHSPHPNSPLHFFNLLIPNRAVYSSSMRATMTPTPMQNALGLVWPNNFRCGEKWVARERLCGCHHLMKFLHFLLRINASFNYFPQKLYRMSTLQYLPPPPFWTLRDSHVGTSMPIDAKGP